jgi:MFS superfamily sulfate permease-like transporter
MIGEAGGFAGYNAERFRKDLTAGLVIGIIAIPLERGCRGT